MKYARLALLNVFYPIYFFVGIVGGVDVCQLTKCRQLIILSVGRRVLMQCQVISMVNTLSAYVLQSTPFSIATHIIAATDKPKRPPLYNDELLDVVHG
jgi:hypothetical protein